MEDRSRRYYAKSCCGHHKHDTIQEALECTNVEHPDAPKGVRALVWAWGNWSFVGLTPNEMSTLSQLTNPAWWDRHRPGWRERKKS